MATVVVGGKEEDETILWGNPKDMPGFRSCDMLPN